MSLTGLTEGSPEAIGIRGFCLSRVIFYLLLTSAHGSNQPCFTHTDTLDRMCVCATGAHVTVTLVL